MHISICACMSVCYMCFLTSFSFWCFFFYPSSLGGYIVFSSMIISIGFLLAWFGFCVCSSLSFGFGFLFSFICCCCYCCYFLVCVNFSFIEHGNFFFCPEYFFCSHDICASTHRNNLQILLVCIYIQNIRYVCCYCCCCYFWWIFLYSFCFIYLKKKTIFELTFLCNTLCRHYDFLIRLITTKLYYLSMSVKHAYRFFSFFSFLPWVVKFLFNCYCQNLSYFITFFPLALLLWLLRYLLE